MIKKSLITVAMSLITICTFAQHTIVLKSGERIRGRVAEIKNDVVTINIGAEVKTVKVEDLNMVYFEEKQATQAYLDNKANVPSGTMTAEVPGRKLIKTPEMKILTQDKGIVVVAIIVDKYGRVKSAQPGAEGTNTTSQYLFTKAKQAAEASIFDTSPTAPLETKGIITVVY